MTGSLAFTFGASPCSCLAGMGSSSFGPASRTAGCNELLGSVNSGSTHPNSGGAKISRWC